jgi:6-pyruvoyltetrahydropterin 2'-reductase
MKVQVAEQFYSIQGEGPFAGMPSIFLRLSGCNLVCGGRENAQRDKEDMEPEGDATWVCDTIDVWREIEEEFTPSELIDRWEDEGWISYLKHESHLVLTGGEPTLSAHQEAMVEVFELLRDRHNFEPFVEVETNGTKRPHSDFERFVDQWNVSLKLSNSGMERSARLNKKPLLTYSGHPPTSKATFKFVVSSEDDLDEIEEIVRSFGIDSEQVMLMPAGQTQEQLRQTYPIVAEACKNRGWQFSPRLQVDVWGEVTGV